MIKNLLVLISIIVLGTLAYGVYYAKSNTSFLGTSNNSQNITQNNLTNMDLTLKEVIVPDQFKKGVFTQARTVNIANDYEIEVFVGGLRAPRSFALDLNENMYITDKALGQVLVVKNGTQDPVVFDSSLKNVHGIEFNNGYLYVAEEAQLNRYKLSNDPTKYDEKKVLIPNLSGGGIHVTRTVRIGPDDKIYISTGSSCNVCEEDDKRKAAITTYNLDGTGEQIVYEGLRNSVGFIFKDNLGWSVDNGRDMLGDNKPTEEVNVFTPGQKTHFGWPFCHGRGFANPEYPNQKAFCENETSRPLFEMQAHSAPLGLAFDGENNLFVALHGSWNRSERTGYKIIAFDIDKYREEVEAKQNNSDLRGISYDEDQDRNEDYFNIRYQDFITGWLDENGEVWGRPVDVIFNSVGDMFITDDSAGVVYRVYKN